MTRQDDAVILSRYRAGDNLRSLSADYDLTWDEVATALLRAQAEETKEACAKRINDLRGNLVPLVKPGMTLSKAERDEIESTMALILDACVTAIRALPPDAGKEPR